MARPRISLLRRRILLAVVLLAALGAWGAGRDLAGWLTARAITAAFPEVPWIAPDAIGGAVLLDVRPESEFAVAHLPGARRVDPDADPATLHRALPRGRSVVVYCSVGGRSARLAARLRDVGRADVHNLEGSLFGWAMAGRPLVDGSGRPTARVHPYGAPWSWLLPARLRAE
jgi:rhodanese-related sulfurtransferase